MILMGNALFTDYPYVNSNILNVVRNLQVAGDRVPQSLKRHTWFVSENGYGIITRLRVPIDSDKEFDFDTKKDWLKDPDCYIRMIELLHLYHHNAQLHIIDPGNFKNWFYEPASVQFYFVCPHLFTQHLNHWLNVAPLKIRFANNKRLMIKQYNQVLIVPVLMYLYCMSHRNQVAGDLYFRRRPQGYAI